MMVAQSVLLSAAAGLLAYPFAAAAATNDAITSETYFYGHSPPVYPAREFSFVPACLFLASC
jgi:hypothetical protein